MSRGTRKNDDIPLGPQTELKYATVSRSLLPTNYSYPDGFQLGEGRIGLVQRTLLPLYGIVGELENRITPQLLKKASNPLLEYDCDFIIRGLRQKIEDYSVIAAAMNGELDAFGAPFYIPRQLRGHIGYIKGVHGRLVDWADEVYLNEQYPVPDGFPSGQSPFEVLFLHSPVIFSDDVKDEMQLGDLNDFLSKLYASIAFHANRIRCLRRIRQIKFSERGKEAFEVHLKHSVLLFSNALCVIEKRIHSRAELFLMPNDIRIQMMRVFCAYGRYPIGDVTVLLNPSPWKENRRDISLFCCELDNIEKNIYSLSTTLRSSLSVRLPQLSAQVNCDRSYAILARFIANNSTTFEEAGDLRAVFMLHRPGEVQSLFTEVEIAKIVSAANSSIGQPLAALDWLYIRHLASMVIKALDYEAYLMNNLSEMMKTRLPNFTALMGVTDGSRLIKSAGGIENLFTQLRTYRRCGSGLEPRVYDTLLGVYLVPAETKRQFCRHLSQFCLEAIHLDAVKEFPLSSYGVGLRKKVDLLAYHLVSQDDSD